MSENLWGDKPRLPLKRFINHSKNPCCFGVWIVIWIGLAFVVGVLVGDGIAVGEGTNVTVGVGNLVGIRVGILVGMRSGRGVLVGITSMDCRCCVSTTGAV